MPTFADLGLEQPINAFRFFFSVESDGEGPRSKFEREDGQTDGEKLARASICDVMVPHWCHLAIMARSRD